MDTVSDHGKEISSSNAMIGINLPGVGQISQVSVPFKTRAEMTNTALKDIKPVNWAAFCLSVKFDAVEGRDLLKVKRLNGLAVFKPNPV